MKFLAVVGNRSGPWISPCTYLMAIVGFAILAIVQNGMVVQGAQCDNQKYQTCMESFSEALGFPFMPQDIRVILAKIAVLQKDLNGQTKLCKYDVKMKQF